jgi:hypothetical protein
MPQTALKLLAVVIVTVLSLVSVDLAARLFVVPSTMSYGTLMGRELPPMRLMTRSTAPELLDPSTPIQGAPGGATITRGDLWGHFRLDSQLRDTYQESVTAKNRWWQSNNLGARDRTNVERRLTPGRQRILLFGESFAQGSRLPQDEAWPAVLQDADHSLEVLNFAVDGYSMAQSLLRFRQIRQLLDYDLVVLMFVPEADLVRDINTLRQLLNSSWDMPLMPRFLLRPDGLTLVPPLYSDPLDLYRRNADRLSPELTAYLRTYDRLYFPSKYEHSRVFGQSILAKLIARAGWIAEDRELRGSLMSPRGEALQVSRAIFDSMQREALADGASFALVVLPMENGWWDKSAGTRNLEQWQEMASFVCAARAACVDLLPVLRELPSTEVDRAFDGWHFGPRMNRHIAASVKDSVISQPSK